MPRFKGKMQGRSGPPKVKEEPRLVSVSGAASGVAVTTDESEGPHDVLVIWMTSGEKADKSPVRVGTVCATPDGPAFVKHMPGDLPWGTS